MSQAPEQGTAGPALVIPENALAAEIEFALAYVLACHPPAWRFLVTQRRRMCEEIAAVLAERAAKGLSGMEAGHASGNPATGRNL